MINKLWTCMLVCSIIFGILVGRTDEINNAIFLSFKNTTEMIISITSIMCFWCGMIKIIKNTNILGFFNKIFYPFVNYFYKKNNKVTKEFIVINIFSNIFGIGNAATPAGINAMKEMEKESDSKRMSADMNLFILMNTLSVQIVPTTVMSIMISYGNDNTAKIIVPILITSMITFVIIMFLGKYILNREEESNG